MGKALTKPPFVQRLCLGLPARTLFLSDLHIRPNTLMTIENILSAIQTLEPELILMGGDYAEYDEGFIRFFSAISSVRPRLGIFAVEGNNDVTRFSGDRDRVKTEMEKSGVRLLRDECVKIDTGKGEIELLGARDAYFENTRPGGLFTDDKAAYKILLAHEPLKSTLEAVCGRADLMLSGHTHGGQVNALGLTCYEILNYEKDFHYTHIAGLKKIQNTKVLVSRGVGTSKFSVRFGARAEIHLIT